MLNSKLVTSIVHANGNVLVEGNAGSGLTTLLSAVIAEIKLSGNRVVAVDTTGGLCDVCQAAGVSIVAEDLSTVRRVMIQVMKSDASESMLSVVIDDISFLEDNPVGSTVLCNLLMTDMSSGVRIIMGRQTNGPKAISSYLLQYIDASYSIRHTDKNYVHLSAGRETWVEYYLPTKENILQAVDESKYLVFNSSLVHEIVRAKGNCLIMGNAASGISTTLAAVAIEAKQRGEKVLITEEEGCIAEVGDAANIKVFSGALYGLHQILDEFKQRISGPIRTKVPLRVIIDEADFCLYNDDARAMLIYALDSARAANAKFVLGGHLVGKDKLLDPDLRRNIGDIFNIRKSEKGVQWFAAYEDAWGDSKLPTIPEMLEMLDTVNAL